MPLINFSGLASGIDSEALISATSDAARAVRITPSENRIKALEDTNSALSDLKAKLSAIQAKLQAMASTGGGALSKKATSSDTTIVSASASTTATNGTYSLTVTELATTATHSYKPAAGTWGSTDAVFSPTSVAETLVVQIGSPTPEEVNVPITATTTLSDVVNAINAGTTNATASLVNLGTTGSPNYRLIISTNKTGEDEGTLNVLLQGNIATDVAKDAASSEATNSVFDISGIGTAIERSTNSVSDLIPGVTFELKTTGGPASITVADDIESTSSKVQDFISAFNELVALIQEKNIITREQEGEKVTNTFGALSQSRVDDNSLTSLRTALSASVYYNTGSYETATNEIRIMADLGITTDSGAYNAEDSTGGGTLKFDSDVLSSAISKEPNSVNEILQAFADAVSLTEDPNTGNEGVIHSYIKFNGLVDTSVNSNKDLIDDLNDRIAVAESAILKQEETMRMRFSRLESAIGKMQSQASALSSALASLPSLTR